MLTKKRDLLELHVKKNLYTLAEYDESGKPMYVVHVNKQVRTASQDIFKCVRYILNKWEEAHAT